MRESYIWCYIYNNNGVSREYTCIYLFYIIIIIYIYIYIYIHVYVYIYIYIIYNIIITICIYKT